MFQPINSTEISPPHCVDDVVELLLVDLTLKERGILANLSEPELETSVYLAMAKIIRKEFGLYNGNAELLLSCKSYLGKEYDLFEDPAMVIIKELWKKVKNSHHLRLVTKRRS